MNWPSISAGKVDINNPTRRGHITSLNQNNILTIDKMKQLVEKYNLSIKSDVFFAFSLPKIELTKGIKYDMLPKYFTSTLLYCAVNALILCIVGIFNNVIFERSFFK